MSYGGLPKDYKAFPSDINRGIKMSKFELTKAQKRELDNLIEVIQTEADIVKMDYEQNPSNLDSGSVIVVHQDSPLLQSTKEKLGDVAYNVKRKKK